MFLRFGGRCHSYEQVTCQAKNVLPFQMIRIIYQVVVGQYRRDCLHDSKSCFGSWPPFIWLNTTEILRSPKGYKAYVLAVAGAGAPMIAPPLSGAAAIRPARPLERMSKSPTQDDVGTTLL